MARCEPNAPRYVCSSSMTMYFRFEKIKSKPALLWLGRNALLSISGLVRMMLAFFLIRLRSAGGVSPSYTPADSLCCPNASVQGCIARYWSLARAFVGYRKIALDWGLVSISCMTGRRNPRVLPLAVEVVMTIFFPCMAWVNISA